ncbi:hypothetical protein LXL04_016806 [Taraxacum kok-saghyz]
MINHTTAIKSKGIWGEETNGRDKCVNWGANWGCFLPLSCEFNPSAPRGVQKLPSRDREKDTREIGQLLDGADEPRGRERAAGSRKQSPVPKTADHADLGLLKSKGTCLLKISCKDELRRRIRQTTLLTFQARKKIGLPLNGFKIQQSIIGSKIGFVSWHLDHLW